MGIFYICLLSITWAAQAVLYFKTGCVGGKPGAPYICEEETALIIYTVFSLAIFIMLILLIKSELKKRSLKK